MKIPETLLPQLNSGMSADELDALQIHFCHLALATEPARREPLIKLAQIYSRRGMWVPANYYVEAALELPWYPFYGANVQFYTVEPYAIGYRAAGWSGNIKKAQEYILKCLEYEPYNPEYLRDTQFYFDYAAPNIEGWMRYPELLWLFKTAQKMESVLEVGSWQGRSSHALLSGCKGKVTCVDTFLGTDDPNDGTYQQGERLDVYGKFMANVGHFKNLEVLRMTSEEAAQAVGDRKFDMIFLDANHTEEGLKKDIELWKDKATLILCGHDYGSGWPGVQAAVDIQLNSYDELNDTIWSKNLVKPLISICIPTLGRKDKLNRLLKSIKENAGYDNYEIVIEEDQMPPNNLGAPKMLAKCLLRARGEHILFLGNDCVVEANLLQELVWQMARSFPEQDGMVGINDQYWSGDKGHVATHFLISRKLIDKLDGEIFHVGYNHCGGDNELLCRASALEKYVWSEKAKIFHDHPINSGFAWSDPLYEQAYAGPRHEADDALYKERAEKYGFADRKWD